MRTIWLTCFLFFLLLGDRIVEGQGPVCSVTSYFWDDGSKSSSSRFLIGEFPLKLEDDILVKEFKHEETGVIVNVGVQEVKGITKQDPKRLRVAISFEGKPENIFDELGRAQAETIYDHNWKWLSVSKSIRIKRRIYTFSFGCEKTVVKIK